MSKIVYNSTNMTVHTIGHLKNCVNSMQKAINTSQSMSQPSDYEDIEYLKKLSTTIKNNSDNLTDLINWINENNNKYANIVKDFENNIFDIDTISIKKRIGYISQK